MSTVNSILTSVSYDLKLSSTTLSTRTNELINYMNRVITNGITPTLVRFESEYGLKEWVAAETTPYLRRYTLPTDFLSFYHVYCIEENLNGTFSAVTSTSSVTLDSSGSTADDAYNGYYVRVTSGSNADAVTGQTTIIDYDGDTRVATLSPALGALPGTTDTYRIFEAPADTDELDQVELSKLYRDYSSAEKPSVYSVAQSGSSTTTTVYMETGGIPDASGYILYGRYFFWPTALSSSSDVLPYPAVFDEVIRSYTSMMAMNRDEYDIRVESALLQGIQQDISSIIHSRTRGRPRPAQSRIYGSR